MRSEWGRSLEDIRAVLARGVREPPSIGLPDRWVSELHEPIAAAVAQRSQA